MNNAKLFKLLAQFVQTIVQIIGCVLKRKGAVVGSGYRADIAYLGAEAAVGGHLNLRVQLLSASLHAGETQGIKLSAGAQSSGGTALSSTLKKAHAGWECSRDLISIKCI